MNSAEDVVAALGHPEQREQQNLRLRANVKVHLDRLASAAGESLPQYCIRVLEQHVIQKREDLTCLYEEEARQARLLARVAVDNLDALPAQLESASPGRQRSSPRT